MMETSCGVGSGLYRKLLRDSWWALDDAVRRLHASGGSIHALGVFRVRLGTSRLARLLAWIARLPSASEAVDTQLLVTAGDDVEEWRRTFAASQLVTLQSARPDGLLAERVGPFELRFRLQVVNGALTYQTVSAALSLGPLRFPLPHWFSPRVSAWERSVDDGNRIEVSVEVNFPLVGYLIAYEGKLTHVEAQG